MIFKGFSSEGILINYTRHLETKGGNFLQRIVKILSI